MPKKKRKSKQPPSELDSHLEDLFLETWLAQFPNLRPTPQFSFHPKIKYRMDFAWPHKKVAVEIQGMGPGHCSLKGMTHDYTRHIEALLLNWKIVYLTTSHLNSKHRFYIFNKIAQLLGAPQAMPKPTLFYVPLRKR